MRCSFVVSAASALVLFSSISSAAVVKYKATLDGAQQVPPVDSRATGSADLDFDDSTKLLSGIISLDLPKEVKVNNQHIHNAACGETGNIVLPLTPPGDNGVIAIDPPLEVDGDLRKALEAGELYINIHSEKFPTGEVRGQIMKEDATTTCPPGAGGSSDAGAGTTSDPTPTADPAADGGTADEKGGDDGGGCHAAGSPATSNGALVAIALGAVLSAARRWRLRS